MGKGMMKGLGLILAVLFLSSCTMRSYVQDKGRVDQEMTGNGGCIQGTCPQVDRSDLPQTRRTYVLEFITGPDKLEEDAMVTEAVVEEVSIPAKETNFAKTRPMASEQTVIAEEVVVVEPSYIEYKIEEGDTLQKISKKFYDTYGRWNEIYEANKDVLSSPDRIKPGKTIRIPQK